MWLLRRVTKSEPPPQGPSCNNATLTAGVADAVAINEKERIDAVVDWKSDVDPAPNQLEIYRGQVLDYLAATGASRGLIVFMTSGRVEHVRTPD